MSPGNFYGIILQQRAAPVSLVKSPPDIACGFNHFVTSHAENCYVNDS